MLELGFHLNQTQSKGKRDVKKRKNEESWATSDEPSSHEFTFSISIES